MSEYNEKAIIEELRRIRKHLLSIRVGIIFLVFFGVWAALEYLFIKA